MSEMSSEIFGKESDIEVSLDMLQYFLEVFLHDQYSDQIGVANA